MTLESWLQLAALVVLVAILAPPLGSYMAKVFGGGKAPGDRVFGPDRAPAVPRHRRRPRTGAALDRLRRRGCSPSAWSRYWCCTCCSVCRDPSRSTRPVSARFLLR